MVQSSTLQNLISFYLSVLRQPNTSVSLIWNETASLESQFNWLEQKSYFQSETGPILNSTKTM
jgi:hypothetical protein